MSTPSEHPNLHEENEDPDAFATWAVGIGGALITIASRGAWATVINLIGIPNDFVRGII